MGSVQIAELLTAGTKTQAAYPTRAQSNKGLPDLVPTTLGIAQWIQKSGDPGQAVRSPGDQKSKGGTAYDERDHQLKKISTSQKEHGHGCSHDKPRRRKVRLEDN